MFKFTKKITIIILFCKIVFSNFGYSFKLNQKLLYLLSMKPLQELLDNAPYTRAELRRTELRSVISSKIDFDVYLPTKGKNLQRPFVWTLEQKRELIWSMLLQRPIPTISLYVDSDGEGNDIKQVIDGKQRLSSMIDFLNDKFTIVVEGKEYFYSQLPQDYQTAIRSCPIPCYLAYNSRPLSDQDKINWFKIINFGGTAQDVEHLKGLG